MIDSNLVYRLEGNNSFDTIVTIPVSSFEEAIIMISKIVSVQNVLSAHFIQTANGLITRKVNFNLP
jgi:hypothetical protein